MTIRDVGTGGPAGLRSLTSGRIAMTEAQCICRQILWLVTLFALALLVACLPAAEEPTPITPISPRALSGFLVDVHPDQGAILPLDDYTAEVCVQVNACELLCEGDFWEFEDVYTRTTILVDNQPTGGLVGYVSDYIMGCYIEDSQGNELARAGGPYEWCVCAAPIAVGIHRVDISFERSSGEIVSFAWTFELVSGPVPTPTPLPGPLEVDRVGYLPGYIEAVFPLPGETFLPSQDPEGWSDLLENRGMPPARLTGPDMEPVCVALAYSELLELGTLPSGNHFTIAFTSQLMVVILVTGCIPCPDFLVDFPVLVRYYRSASKRSWRLGSTLPHSTLIRSTLACLPTVGPLRLKSTDTASRSWRYDRR